MANLNSFLIEKYADIRDQVISEFMKSTLSAEEYLTKHPTVTVSSKFKYAEGEVNINVEIPTGSVLSEGNFMVDMLSNENWFYTSKIDK